MRKPDYFTKTMGSYTCSACESDIFFVAAKSRTVKHAVDVQQKFKTISPMLQAMLDEELVAKSAGEVSDEGA